MRSYLDYFRITIAKLHSDLPACFETKELSVKAEESYHPVSIEIIHPNQAVENKTAKLLEFDTNECFFVENRTT